jgi:hypothetical protein
MAADPRKLERLRQAIAHDLVVAQRLAARKVRKFVGGEAPDSELPWNEVHGATRGALSLVQASLAAERANTMSQAPRALGVVVVHGRLEDTAPNRLRWEASAAGLNAARDEKAIEAVAVPVEVKSG